MTTMKADASPVAAFLAERRIELTPAARARFTGVWREALARHGQGEGANSAALEAELSAAAKYLAGSLTPAEVGHWLIVARIDAGATLAAARVIGRLAVEDGAPEAGTARDLGVDRMALRKWLGKR